jgi:hypothetical protein
MSKDYDKIKTKKVKAWGLKTLEDGDIWLVRMTKEACQQFLLPDSEIIRVEIKEII